MRSAPRLPLRRVVPLVVSFAVLVLLAACGGDDHPPGVHEARGVVKAVLAEDGQLVVDHEDIEGLMPAMTMSFDVADPGLLEGVEAGDTIVFHLDAAEGRYRILNLRVTGTAGEAGAAGGGSFDPADRAEAAPPFTLTDHEGRTLSLADLRGRTVLLDFIYTNCPGPCPLLTSTHVRVQRTLPAEVRERVHFVSITIDPERDDGEALRRYAEARGVDLSDWSFLTGTPETVDEVLRAYGVGQTPGENGEIVHVVATYLIDAQGRIAERYVGLEHHADELRADVERVARTAS